VQNPVDRPNGNFSYPCNILNGEFCHNKIYMNVLYCNLFI